MRYAIFVIAATVALAITGMASAPTAITQTMAGAADNLFALFKDKSFPLLLAGGIIIAGLALAAAYGLLLVLPVWWQMKKRCRQIARYSTRADFASDYPTVYQDLERDPVIRHPWREFCETVYESDTHPPEIRNTVRPHAFINTTHVQEHNFALKLMPHLPNYFVGIGLLLTFVGLIAALNFATASVGGNVDQAVTGLENLLKAATFKFWTSIAGLGMSIILSLIFRIYSNVIERSLIDLCDTLEHRMKFASGQEILADMLSIQREQSDEFKKFNTEVAFTIGQEVNNNINQQLPQAIQTALQPVTDEVRKQSEAVVNQNQENVGAMVDKFTESLEGGAGSHMQSIAETLQQLQTTLQGMQGSVDSSGDAFAQRMAEGTERLESTMREMSSAVSDLVSQLRDQMSEATNGITDQLEQTLQRISQESEAAASQLANQGASASQRFADNIQAGSETLQGSINAIDSSISGLSDRLQQLDSTLSRQADAFNEVVGQERTVAESLRGATQSLQQGVKPWEQAGQQLASTMERFETNLTQTSDQLQQALTGSQQLVETLQALSQSLHDSWESYRQRFESVDQDLERAFQQITEAVDTQQRRIQDFVQEIDKSFTNATEKLNGTVTDIAESADALNDALNNWVKPESLQR